MSSLPNATTLLVTSGSTGVPETLKLPLPGPAGWGELCSTARDVRRRETRDPERLSATENSCFIVGHTTESRPVTAAVNRPVVDGPSTAMVILVKKSYQPLRVIIDQH